VSEIGTAFKGKPVLLYTKMKLHQSFTIYINTLPKPTYRSSNLSVSDLDSARS